MAWNAKILSTERPNGNLNIIVEYSNGADLFQDKITINTTQSSDWLVEQVSNKILNLNDLDTFQSTISQGAVKPVVEQPPTISSQEQARLDFQDNYNSYKKMQTAIANGLMKDTDQTYLDEVAYIKANYIDSYKDLIY